MTGFTALWLPILLAAVAAFLASSIIHMVLPWHKNDYAPMPRENDFAAALRPLQIPPGDYLVPRPRSRADLNSPEFKQRRAQGPVMFLTVLPNGDIGMGSSLARWFVFLLVAITLVVAIASRLVAPGAPFTHVFHVVGAIAFLAFACALWPLTIWQRRALRITLAANLDGLIYAVITAAICAALWPK